MNQRTFYQQLVERYVAATASKEELDLLFHLMDDKEFCEVMTETMDQHLLQNLEKAKQAKVIALRKKRYRLVSIAASLIFMLSIASFFFVSNYNKDEKSKQPPIVKADIINPGEDRAILTLSNGEQIILTNQKDGLLTEQAGIQVYKSKEGMLVYKMRTGIGAKAESEYNTISTPKGGQYQVVLEDGSKIWLNAESSIKLPTSFGAKSRAIEITGEVYCEIAKDPKRPFKVTTNEQIVEVLGTHFVINAYPDEKFTKTTLIEGSVKIVNTDNMLSKTIKPGEQARISNRNQPDLNISQVDVQYETAWKDGFFMFQNKTLESIMREVARWYNVEVVYKGAIPQASFGGKISKFEDVQKILDILSDASNIKFKTEGRRIFVIN